MVGEIIVKLKIPIRGLMILDSFLILLAFYALLYKLLSNIFLLQLEKLAISPLFQG